MPILTTSMFPDSHARRLMRGVCAAAALWVCGCQPSPASSHPENPSPMPNPAVHVEDSGAAQPDAPEPTLVEPDVGEPDVGEPDVEEPFPGPAPATPEDTGPSRVDNNADPGPIVCDGKYRAGEQFKRACNSCSCSEDGQVRCTLMACLPAAK